MEKILGLKVNMTQIFLENGKVIPVTIIKSLSDLNDELLNKAVVVIGTSKGKGFTGGMKRWGFSGARATRGQSNKPRAIGSIGSQTPGRVRKGKKMAGRSGGAQVTIKGLKIVKVDAAEKQMMISGPVPGARNSKVEIRVL
jgi:large subunit ribosomal protein L3